MRPVLLALLLLSATDEQRLEATVKDETEADEFGAVGQAVVEFMARWKRF